MVSREQQATDRRRQLTIEIEAVEHAIENAFFTVEVEALRKQLARLQEELEEL
jgi:hypothetical protein